MSQPSDLHPKSDIVLVAINARYRHTAFGLRCLQANLGALQERSVIIETTLQQRAMEIVEAIVPYAPRIVGLGVYIWNVQLSTEVVALLKRVLPETVVVLGGPEVSYETKGQAIVEFADYTVCGEGEQAFAALCESLLNGESPSQTIIDGTSPAMDQLQLPYGLYTEEDLEHRVVYVEASRGCPFKCQFCLSSLDRAVRTVPMPAFLHEMEVLLSRGARDFKFIDRTFNLRMDFSLAIVDFFLERCVDGLSLHFEMVPDRLPDELKTALAQFPPGVVQLEVGIQTFDMDVAKRIQRRQDYDKVIENLKYLNEHTHTHLHTDLIVGLPGEDVSAFAKGFDRLMAVGPQEIQVGILKRLKGTPIVMHDEAFGMVYSPLPPFDVLYTDAVSFDEMQRMKRFASYWDRVSNSGNFVETAQLLCNAPSPFEAFMAFSEWLYSELHATSHINLLKLADRLFVYLTEQRGLSMDVVGAAMVRDYNRTAGRKTPRFLKPYLSDGVSERPVSAGGLSRQKRHLAAS